MVVETQHIHEDEEDDDEDGDMIELEIPVNIKSTKYTNTVNEGGGITSGQN
jgi:hypothetical protein